jgi:hypothetical protein
MLRRCAILLRSLTCGCCGLMRSVCDQWRRPSAYPWAWLREVGTPPASVAPIAFRGAFIPAPATIIRPPARPGTTGLATAVSIRQVRPVERLIGPPAPLVNALRRDPMPTATAVTLAALGPWVRSECARAVATTRPGCALTPVSGRHRRHQPGAAVRLPSRGANSGGWSRWRPVGTSHTAPR